MATKSNVGGNKKAKTEEGHWIKCPKCKGVDSIYYGMGGRPMACSTCDGYGSIFERTASVASLPVCRPRNSGMITDLLLNNMC